MFSLVLHLNVESSVMASLPDSSAYFESRAKEYEVAADLLAALNLAGIRTMGHLAFALSRPGQDFDEDKFEDWLKTVNNGTLPTLGAVAAVRRLHFEAEIVLTATLHASVDQSSESSTPKPLPFAERAARLNQLKKQFPGQPLWRQ